MNYNAGIAALETIKAGMIFADPKVLMSGSTYMQQHFQHGQIAMADLWSSRAGAMNDDPESQIVGKVVIAAAPTTMVGGGPVTTLWWDGIVVAADITGAEADAAFRGHGRA